MDDELDETITVPRLPMVRPAVRPVRDFDDTLPARPADRSAPPPLVEPRLRPGLDEQSGIELVASPEDPGLVDTESDVATAPYTPSFDTQPQPVQEFYRFRIGKTVVWLDAVSYVGRRPSSPRIIYGQMPRLVRVPSPKHEVSSTHVEVRQLGASVVLTDMRSTNGSVVFPPGGQPRKLRQGESVVTTPGTLVDIGDGNVIEILPLEARSGPGRDDSGSTEGRQ